MTPAATALNFRRFMWGWRSLALGLLAALGNGFAQAQLQTDVPFPKTEIYTCVDANGRKLTSDRPIMTCRDREQKILNPSGTVKSKVGPTLSSKELSQLEALNKIEMVERARQDEEKRRDRALLIRYPTPSAHQKERADTLEHINLVRQTALVRTKDLLDQRTKLTDEMAFYTKDPSKAPPLLQHQLSEVNQALAAQGRFLAEKDAEIARTNARFDAELVRLMPLWRLSASQIN